VRDEIQNAINCVIELQEFREYSGNADGRGGKRKFSHLLKSLT
jgi:hypothetical protein